ncbi:sulfite exporter TauE/SafE family protein [Patescibacteria group bacterium]
MFKEYSILAAFIAGLLHVLEPCEDKAIVSFYVAWAGENIKETVKLIILYSFGMIFINIFIGLVVSFIGMRYLNSFSHYFLIGSGVFTIIFGLLIIKHSHLFGNHCLLEHSKKKFNIKDKKSVLLFGLLRGLPLCPVEIAVMLWAASVGNIFRGTLLVASFSIGTSISLIPFGIGAKGIFKFIDQKSTQKVKKYIQVSIGILVMLIGIISIIGFGHLH